MRRVVEWTALIMVLVGSCGGAQSPPAAAPGDTHAEPAPDDLDLPNGFDTEDSTASATDPAEQNGPAQPPAVTFKLINRAESELVFSVDKGWQPVIFAFSGKPPQAKSILLFPKFCTASCDAPQQEQCLACPEPETVQEVKQAEKREVLAPGATLEVPWDGQVFVYEKSTSQPAGSEQACECYRKQAVPPETYTVRACGLRITTTATEASRYQCVDGSMMFPADGPQTVQLEFAAP